jgi:hypothetical protein
LEETMKVGDRVKTPHGLGTIVGKDLPESRAWRWVVRIEETTMRFTDMHPGGTHWDMKTDAPMHRATLADIQRGVPLCYFERDLKEVEDANTH